MEDFNSLSVSGWEHLGGCHSMTRVAPRLVLLSEWLTQCGGGGESEEKASRQ